MKRANLSTQMSVSIIAAGVLVATNLPALLGYQTTEAGAEGAWTLLWTFGLLRGIGFLAIVPLLFSWPLTRERQERIRAAIKKRNERIGNRI